MNALVATGIQVQLGHTQVLRGTEIKLERGSLRLLAGRNGAGKSTLLRVLCGVRRPDAGRIEVLGREVGLLSARERARLITLIPQHSESPFEFTGRELVMMGRHPHIPRFAAPAAEDREAVATAIAQVDATDFADRPVGTLSGGEARRIALARALATNAQIVLADEPTSSLDPDHAIAVLEVLRGLAAAGRTVLIASHDLLLAWPRVDRAHVLHDGTLRELPDLSPEVRARAHEVADVLRRAYTSQEARSAR